MATIVHPSAALSHSFAPGHASFQSTTSSLPEEEEEYSDEDSNPLGIGSSNGVRALGSGVNLSIADLLAGAVRFVEGSRGLEEEEIPYKAINVRSVVVSSVKLFLGLLIFVRKKSGRKAVERSYLRK